MLRNCVSSEFCAAGKLGNSMQTSQLGSLLEKTLLPIKYVSKRDIRVKAAKELT